MPQEVEIDYVNWRGERSIRRIVPAEHGLIYGCNQWHPEKQWLILAHDVEKDAERTFAVSGIKDWKPVTR